ncbi:uncharacterized protein LOC131208700 isoform X2 [Anopheles bellator]|uniref:uncharacterized protein LOC131208700 isoform X2 n=1 Tax=Anopheles bellator TaxID=139047 RepID=UPI002649048F|nr:uncharacterized protein LOC131208700 isoform X2 [Anopheles bellator]
MFFYCILGCVLVLSGGRSVTEGANLRKNLTQVTWAHAVNDAEYLTRVLDSDIQFIECDISLGYLKEDVNRENEIPIMAHPPANESDISLETFLQRVLQYNQQIMGLPDLPGQPEDDKCFTMDENHTIHVEPFSDDESDNESIGENSGYAGYQPLSVDDRSHPTVHRRLSAMDDERELDDETDFIEPGAVDMYGSSSTEFLNVDVWNAPRPDELNIDIDANKAAEIVTVMASIKLPTTAVPDWARGVPEEEWKENLLQRIRQRQQPEAVDGCSTSAPAAAAAATGPLPAPPLDSGSSRTA